MSHHLIWLVGTGSMAVDYARVFAALSRPLVVIGRGAGSAEKFTAATTLPVVTGGLATFLASDPVLPDAAVVATGVDQLASVTLALLERGVRRILVEKPAGLDGEEIGRVAAATRARGAEVFVAYNRRFYASTRRAREIIEEDGGVSSFTFEFTEWSHQVVAHHAPDAVKRRWLLANSSHVIDLAFHLGGRPRQLVGFSSGSLPWHPHGSAWSGAGITEAGAPFAYHADWDAPGRWGVEILTSARRLILRPMEKLQVQRRASVAIVEEPIDDALDKQLKPGLFAQTKAFLEGERGILPDIEEHLAALRTIEAIERPATTP